MLKKSLHNTFYTFLSLIYVLQYTMNKTKALLNYIEWSNNEAFELADAALKGTHTKQVMNSYLDAIRTQLLTIKDLLENEQTTN